MKNTIYNAIQKQLVIDDGDSSINYKHSQINAKHGIDLDELYQIFKNNNADIFSVNAGNCITLISQYGDEYPLSAYKDSIMTFIKIRTDKLASNDNEILISLLNGCHAFRLDKPNQVFWPWQDLKSYQTNDNYFIMDKSQAENDFDGYINCQRKLKNFKKDNEFFAADLFDYCNRCKVFTAKPPHKEFQGYLPASGQVYIIQKYLDMINYIIYKLINAKNVLEGPFWSSTEYNSTYAWDSELHMSSKNNKYNLDSVKTVLPLFKQIN